MKKIISKIKKLNGRYILIYFLSAFIFMSFFIFVFIDDLMVIKNHSFLISILLLGLYYSIDIAHLVLMLFKLNKNKVNKDENKIN